MFLSILFNMWMTLVSLYKAVDSLPSLLDHDHNYFLYKTYRNHDYGFDWKQYVITEEEGLSFIHPGIPIERIDYMGGASFPKLWVQCLYDKDCEHRGEEFLCIENKCKSCLPELSLPCKEDKNCPRGHECIKDRGVCLNYFTGETIPRKGGKKASPCKKSGLEYNSDSDDIFAVL